MTTPLDLSLTLILDPDKCSYHPPLNVLAQALKGGVSLVQFRHKNTTRDISTPLARQCCQLCHDHNIPFIINDDPLLARDIGANGCHLGQDDTHPKIARDILLNSNTIIGRTARTKKELLALQHEIKEGLCHYIGIGAVFPSTSKIHKNPHFIGIKGLQSLISFAHSLFSPSFPLCAISGINIHNAHHVIATPIHGIAIISAICSSPHPLIATKTLRKIIDDKPVKKTPS